MKIRCQKYRKLIEASTIEVLDSNAQARLEAHTMTCDDCRAYRAEVLNLVGTMHSDPSDVRSETYWSGYYDRLMERIEEEEASVPVPRSVPESRIADWLRLPTRPAFQLAYVTAVLLIGILIGRTLLNGESDERNDIAGGSSDTGVELVSVDQRADRFLDRSKVLLLGIINTDTDNADTPIDMSRSRLVANDLIQEAGPLRRDLEHTDQHKLLMLLDDLEVILLQIANLEENADLPAIEMVRDGVDRKAVLLKINVTEMRKEVIGDDI